MMQDDDRLISALEVAYRAGLHPATIYRKAMRGDIPGLVRLGKTVRFKESVIQMWIKGEQISQQDESVQGKRDSIIVNQVNRRGQP